MDIKITELLINLNEIKLIAVMIFVTVLVLGGLILLKPLLKDILSIVIGKLFKNGNGNNNIQKRD
ncbi:holin, BlyA family (plasmid) [Borreliella burgdorferi 29805]|uniref:Holin, BlyA family n=2 Tax=Borreliella TaxID=64895 RepID=C0R8H8_BORVA|nr:MULTISPECIES: BlyA family holin [Borreliella]ACK74350.1 holin, BlyA family protein [Borreliella burgdorferi ZS7]ACM10181.1 holin, BlyA family [Borreliella burgdorferi 72a]ACN52771.1 holin, BlyA family [Borreliella valaisiana VS116]ACO38096.1 holin, BlyA family [Borreliella burgdorferi 29805]EEH31230.1 holin, BlyA family [Borreliella burgdorferi Bol26]